MLNIMDTVILLNLNSQVALNQFFYKAVCINFLKKSMCKRSIGKVFYFSQMSDKQAAPQRFSYYHDAVLQLLRGAIRFVLF